VSIVKSRKQLKIVLLIAQDLAFRMHLNFLIKEVTLLPANYKDSTFFFLL